MKWIVILVCVASVLYVHWRGRVRLRWWRQLINHSTFMAPLNVLMQLLSTVPRTPFVPLAALPELAPLQQNWPAIRAEAEGLLAFKYALAGQESDALQRAAQPDAPLAAQLDGNLQAFLQRGWKGFYLKWYDAVHPSAARLCPRTFALLQAIPSIKVATFAELPPGGRISPHRDPYAGWLRYHLGLDTPGDASWIVVDGERHPWRNGHAMVFDETYIHWAENRGERGRLILLCDIERPMRWRWAQALNGLLGRTLMVATGPPHVPDTATGIAGRLSAAVIGFGHFRRRFKAWSPAAYRASLVLAALALGVLLWWL